MRAAPDPATSLALRDLQYAYAAAVDRRDAAALLGVFLEDATLRVFEPDGDEPLVEAHGHDQLVLMTDAMQQRYAKTMHVMTNSRCFVDGDLATGEVYGVAHHLILDDGPPRTFVAHLRYDDSFGHAPGGAWRIARRDIHFLWAQEAPALAWDDATRRGRLA